MHSTSTEVSACPNEHVHAASLGDKDALGWLYEQYADKVRRWIETKTVGNRDLADDIAQDTWVKVARAITQYNPAKAGAQGFEGWLFTIARNEIRDNHGRRASKREQLTAEMLDHDTTDAGIGPEETAERASLKARMAAELAALPANQRVCLIHRVYSGMTAAETARVMGIKENAVRQLQFRASKALAKRVPDLAGLFVSDPPTLQVLPDSTTSTTKEASL